MADPKIRYDIEAAVKGDASVEELARTLEGLGQTLEGDLKTQADAAAAALGALGAKQQAVDSFIALRRETEALGTSMDSAAQRVDNLGAQLPQAAAATERFTQAENLARTAVAGAQAELDEQRQALVALRQEFTGAARRTDEYREAEAQLRVTVRDLRTNLAEKKQELTSASGATKEAERNEKTLNTEYSNSVNAAKQISSELGAKNRALNSSRAAMDAVGISTRNLAETERNLDAAVAAVRQEVLAMVPAYRAAQEASTASTQRQVQNQKTLRDGMQSISTQLQQIQQIATVALGGSYAGGLIKDVADTADEFKNLEARVKLASGEGEAFTRSFQGVTQVALNTNSALDETGTLFARLTKASQEGGMAAEAAQRRALGLTETINQAAQLSGGAVESSRAAITQLIQGLQSGVLRGEEFNSVMEQAPRLAQAMANGLGVTTGELRKLANEGALTAETVMKALEGQADAVASEFAKLPPTVGRALQNLSTQWTLYVGAADNGLISSENAARVIDALAENLDVLVGTLTAAGKAWAAIKIAGLVADFARWATNTLTATAALESNTAAAARNTVAHRTSAAAQAQNTAVQAANTAATVANTAARAANARAWSEVGAFARASAGAQDAVAAATARSTAAVAANAAGVAKAGVVWRAASGLFGPWGIAVAALTPEILSLGRALGEQVAKWAGWGKVLEENERKLREFDEAAKARAESLAQQNAAYQDAINKTFELSKESVGLIAQFDKLRKDGDSAAEAIGKIGKDFDLSKLPGIQNAAAVLDKLLADGKLTATEFQAAWATALNGQDLARFETLARAAFSGAAREGERLAQVMDAILREAVDRTGLEFEQLQGRIGSAARSAINDLDAIVNGLDRLKAQGVDTSRVLEASFVRAIDTADSQQAIDAVRSRIEELRSTLGQTVTNGLLDQARERALELSDALAAARPGINSLREAMASLGLQTVESLRVSARNAVSAYDTIKRAGQQEGESYVAWQARKQRAAEVMIRRLIEGNGGVADAAIASRAAMEGLEVATDRAGRTIIRSMGEAARSTDGVGRSADQAAGSYRNMAQGAEQAAAAVEKLAQINARYGSPGGGDRYSRPDGGSVTGSSRAERLAGQNAVDASLQFELRDKLRAGTLTEADVDDMRAVISALQQNAAIDQDVDRMSAGAFSNAGMADRMEWARVRVELENALGTIGAQSTRTVQVQLNTPQGRRTVNTDEQGAQALIRTLQDASLASGQ